MKKHATDTLTVEKVDRYISISQKAMSKIRITPPKKTHLRSAADDFLDMARRYIDDAVHFRKEGDLINSFAAINYAHGWLDAGARLGLFDVDHDSSLFTVD